MAAIPMPQFLFEKVATTAGKLASYRPEEDAKKDLYVLLERPDVDAAAIPVSSDGYRLLIRYCMEVPLNIAWYDKARAAAEKKVEEDTQKHVLAAIAVGLGTVASAFIPANHSVVAAQPSAAVGATLSRGAGRP
jgi:hypothetical protein